MRGGPAALPAVHRVGVVAPNPGPAAAALLLGYGYTEGVVATADHHHRLAGAAAVAVFPTEGLAIGLAGQLRHDLHAGGADDGDDGTIFEPHLRLRGRLFEGGGLRLGTEVGLWLPGSDSTSGFADGLSPEFLLLGTAVFDRLTLGVQAGYRWDRSGRSATNADALSLSDRLALGVSDASSVPLGVGLAVTTAPITWLLEVSGDLLVGSSAPQVLESPLRATAGLRWRAASLIDVYWIGEVSASQRPVVQTGAALVPVEPRVATELGVIFLLPGQEAAPSSSGAVPSVVPPTASDDESMVAATGTITGRVLQPNDAPVVEATIAIEGTSPVRSDADGRFTLTDVPAGPVAVTIAADGYRDTTRELEVPGDGAIELEINLERALPDGVLRLTIQGRRGRTVNATIRIEPGGLSGQATGGRFEAVVPPGRHTVIVEAAGYAEQRREIVVEDNGVTLLNISLRSERSPRRRR